MKTILEIIIKALQLVAFTLFIIGCAKFIVTNGQPSQSNHLIR